MLSDHKPNIARIRLDFWRLDVRAAVIRPESAASTSQKRNFWTTVGASLWYGFLFNWPVSHTPTASASSIQFVRQPGTIPGDIADD